MPAPLLSNCLIVSFEQAVAAPYCTARLAQDGARVIKVERPSGDFARDYDQAAMGESSYFVWLNAGKQSIALDLKAPEDQAVAQDMVTRADVVVQNLIPGALSRLGIDLEDEHRRRPRLVTCSISGYGKANPYAGMKAYDLLIQAESGLCAVTGGSDSPARVGISICDIATGMQAYAAILKALLQVEVTGRGRAIELSMFDCMCEWMTVPLLQTKYSGVSPKRIGVAHPSIAPYGVFRAADGIDVLVAVQNDREWERFARTLLTPEVVRDPRFASNVDRVNHRAALDSLICESVASISAASLFEKLAANGIAFARLRTLPEVLEHPAISYVRVMTPSGELELPSPGTGVPDVLPSRVPKLDEDGAAIRKEFARC